MQEKIIDINGKTVEKMELNKKVFDKTVNIALLHQVVYCYLANKRCVRYASTKTRAEVAGSGAKPWRQKGTGRARVGEIRNPIWRKGGVVFGPKPRRVYKKIPKKMKISALKSALNAKQRDKELVILDKLKIKSAKTKELSTILKKLKLNKKSLFVDKTFSKDSLYASRNIHNMSLSQASDLNAYLALSCKHLVITKDALAVLENRILGKKNNLKVKVKAKQKDTGNE